MALELVEFLEGKGGGCWESPLSLAEGAAEEGVVGVSSELFPVEGLTITSV